MSIALALLLAGSAGCSTPFDALYAPADLVGNTPASITIASAPALTVGQSTKVAATIKDATGNVLPEAVVSWSTSDVSIATVAIDGMVSALSSGTVTITATSGKAKGQTVITVQPAGTPATPPVTPPVSTAPSPATLPAMFDTPMPDAPAAGGAVIPVSATDDLQAAIDRANPGDVIELAPGAVFTGNYTLRNKAGTSTAWIVIRPANAATALPALGRRMTPALAAAANLPRIQTPNNSPAIQTEPSAHYYRLIGLDVGVAPAATIVNTLIALGNDASGGQTTLASVPHHIVLDRMYIHGNSTVVLRRGVALNSATSAVIDSYISEVHEKGADSQAIMGWTGPGPYKIVNNYLQSAGEIIMFGGGSPNIPNLVPSDIEVRHNHLTRPVSWKGVWLIKNLFELKNARRVLVEGNVMENNWIAAQDGTGIVLKSTDQDGTAPWSGTTHVTFRLNIVRNTGAAFNIAAHPETFPVEPLHNVSISDNLVSTINVGDFNGSGRVFLAQGGIADLSITHNTVYNETAPYGALILMGSPTDQLVRFNFSNNLTATATNWGVFSDVGAGTATMAAYAPGGTLTANVFAGNAGAGYPTGNYFVPAVSDVGFSNAAAGDFSLLTSSPFKGKASDGKDPGVDMSALLAATNGVVLP
ncbi:MAG: hypothetical protein HOQ31_00160 [Gemmatimonadaceae bacterium]|nr:hypothetical protein [Gemmatimonadaceae bacterium]NUP70745.1 hypothetical protein [Gemmatimonadaceae bacterium]